MKTEEQKERLRQAFLTKAAAVFEAALDRGTGTELTLSQMEETVEGLKFELTSLLVESMIEVQGAGIRGPGPKCAGCGRERIGDGMRNLSAPFQRCEAPIVRILRKTR